MKNLRLFIALIFFGALAVASTDRFLDGQFITNGAFTLTIPTITDTIVTRTNTESLSNKTFVSPVLSNPSFTGTASFAGDLNPDAFNTRALGSDTFNWLEAKAGRFLATGSITGVTADTHTNTTVDNVSPTTGIIAGMSIKGTGIPKGTFIQSISGSTITLSNAATATATGVSITLIQSAQLNPADNSTASSTTDTGILNLRSGNLTGSSTNANTGRAFLRSGNITGAAAAGASGLMVIGSGDISGTGITTAASGSLTQLTGSVTSSTATGATGLFLFNTGTNAGSGATGRITLASGAHSGTGNTGSLLLVSGDHGGPSGNTGIASLASGRVSDPSSTGISGALGIGSGEAQLGRSGNVTISTGPSAKVTAVSPSTASGSLSLITGDATGSGSDSGNFVLASGPATNVRGFLSLDVSAIKILTGATPLSFYNSAETEHVGFKAPATITSTVDWTLPPADGTSGQAIITDGSGHLSFTTIASSTPSINGGSGSPQSVTAGGGISLTSIVYKNYKWIVGNGGAVTVTATPSVTACTADGQELTILGTSNTNTVTLQDQANLASSGLSLNGNWIGAKDSALNLVCDFTQGLWIEVSRR